MNVHGQGRYIDGNWCRPKRLKEESWFRFTVYTTQTTLTQQTKPRRNDMWVIPHKVQAVERQELHIRQE